jgi:hypothetical protein
VFVGGLPHAHILVFLEEPNKPLTARAIDRFTCAEIPNPVTQPALYSVVTACMLHTCRKPCVKTDGTPGCSKHYPQPACDATHIDPLTGFVRYRRQMRHTWVKGSRVYTDRDVIPYNPYLTQRYNCHINVEVVATSQRSVKT